MTASNLMLMIVGCMAVLPLVSLAFVMWRPVTKPLD